MKKMVQSHRHKIHVCFSLYAPTTFTQISLSPLSEIQLYPPPPFAPSPPFHLFHFLLLIQHHTHFSLLQHQGIPTSLSLLYLCNHMYIRSLHLPTCTCTCTYAAFCPTSSLLFTLSTDDSVHVRTWTGQNAVTMMDEICMLAHVISRYDRAEVMKMAYTSTYNVCSINRNSVSLLKCRSLLVCSVYMTPSLIPRLTSAHTLRVAEREPDTCCLRMRQITLEKWGDWILLSHICDMMI